MIRLACRKVCLRGPKWSKTTKLKIIETANATLLTLFPFPRIALFRQGTPNTFRTLYQNSNAANQLECKTPEKVNAVHYDSLFHRYSKIVTVQGICTESSHCLVLQEETFSLPRIEHWGLRHLYTGGDVGAQLRNVAGVSYSCYHIWVSYGFMPSCIVLG